MPYVVAPEPSRTYRVLTVMARLKPGVTDQQADQEMQLLAEQLEREHPEANRGYSAQAITMKDQLPGESNVLLLWLMQGSLVFVLLIASVNVANLLLARGQTRSKELALRATLGATRGRLLRQLLTEGALLAALGAVGGVGSCSRARYAGTPACTRPPPASSVPTRASSRAAARLALDSPAATNVS